MAEKAAAEKAAAEKAAAEKAMAEKVAAEKAAAEKAMAEKAAAEKAAAEKAAAESVDVKVTAAEVEDTSTMTGAHSSQNSFCNEDVCGAEAEGVISDTLCHITVVCGETKPGQSVGIVGSDPALGAWNTSKAVVLSTSPQAFPVWEATLHAPVAGSEFKFVILGSSGVAWEPFANNRRWPQLARGAALTAMYGKHE